MRKAAGGTIVDMAEPAAILCAVDGTAPSRRAAEASGWLATELGAYVVVAHVFDPMGVAVPPAGELAAESLASADVVRAERERARERLASAAALLGGVEH